MKESALVPVEQKMILFYEDELMSVSTGDGSVFVLIKSIIERFGLAGGTSDTDSREFQFLMQSNVCA